MIKLTFLFCGALCTKLVKRSELAAFLAAFQAAEAMDVDAQDGNSGEPVSPLQRSPSLAAAPGDLAPATLCLAALGGEGAAPEGGGEGAAPGGGGEGAQ